MNREAERQKRLNSSRGARRRPTVAAPKTVDKSLSLVEALRDDSDSDDSPDEDADNEDDGFYDQGRDGEKRSRIRSPVPPSPILDVSEEEASPAKHFNGMSKEHLATRLETIFSPEHTSPVVSQGLALTSASPEESSTIPASEPLREAAVLEVIGPFDKTAPLSSLPPVRRFLLSSELGFG